MLNGRCSAGFIFPTRRDGGRIAALLAATLALALMACVAGSDVSASGRFAGTIDTLPSGAVEVLNSNEGMWTESERWKPVEELRIGALDGEGPEVFGRIRDILVDDPGRIYVLESQAQEIRVFDASGEFVRTIGREGEGPGELANPLGMAWGPQGRIWIPDPNNARVSIFDTSGVFVDSHLQPGGFFSIPWPGGIDAEGHFINLVPHRAEDEFQILLVRFDAATMVPVDSIVAPTYEGEENFFELTSETSRMRAGVAFSPGLVWDLDEEGNIWFANTEDYRIYKTTFHGDTLLIVDKPHEVVSVTAEEVDSAVANLKWFTDQGGKVDRARFPSEKPALRRLWVAATGHLLVSPVIEDRELEGRVLDVFDPRGRYLGRVEFPDEMSLVSPGPVVTEGYVYAQVTDELEVPYVVRYALTP